MIDRSVTTLNLLIAAFVAGAIVCAVGLVAAIFRHPLTSADLMPVFAVAALGVGAKRISQQVGMEAERERVRLEGDRLRNAKTAAEIERSRLDDSAMPQKGPATPPDALPGASVPSVFPAHWAAFWRRLAQAGDAHGWTQAALTTEGSPTKVMSEQAWNTTIPMLVAAGWLSGGKPGRATKWATGRGLGLFESVEAWKALPCPDFEPPDIALPPYTTIKQRATTVATIDGTAKIA